ncbi:MAG: Long-chain fatty-acid-CoA ligase [candidate division TM6 bacterium GW2011_GWE2_42_60]|nr:MAG: Long-chain fatty-acid-CoA ligase [candidate division TM6 bacterium GW2011_GWE2_42_60]HBY05634.1 hypothetical protein [Candidatus Dependentiae bacterium]
MKNYKQIYKKRFEALVRSLSPQGNLIHPSTLLKRAATLWPNRTALLYEAEELSFKELFTQAVALAKQLQKKGVKPGDHVLILYENSSNFYRAYHAAWMTGAIVAPLNVFLHEKELTYIVKDAQPTLILVSQTLRSKIEAACAEAAFSTDMLMSIEDLSTRDAQLDLTFSIPHPALDACTVILYTSGTTGMPKGVMLSGKAIMTNCLQGIATFALDDHERIFAILPLFHSYMQNVAVWCTIILGIATIVVPRINRKAIKEGLAKKPTIVLGIPQLFGLFCLMKNLDFSSVRLFVSGGDALHEPTRLGFELLYGRRIVNGYGLTESAPLIAVNLTDTCARPHAVGVPLYGITVAIRDTNAQIGTIWVQGDNLMLGYYNAPEATQKVLVDGWLNTGDLGYLSKDGCLVLAGREKDLIVHKGINIYPQEIEGLLAQHPAVVFAAVVGFKKEETETPVAFVTLSQELADPETTLKQYCREHLAPYKVPHRIFIRTTLPQTATGKIDKKVLKLELQNGIV